MKKIKSFVKYLNRTTRKNRAGEGEGERGREGER
jgi:hypothetical protein